MKQYLDLLQKVLDEGVKKEDRTGVGTLSLFGAQMRFNLQEGFPLVTTKKLYVRAIIHELLWLVSGITNIEYLKENNVSIWDEWADKDGELGPVYGKQWRNWDSWNIKNEEKYGHGYVKIDQLAGVINRIKANPNDRRLIVTAWNPADLPYMALPPCHMLYQFQVSEGKLNCQMYQRSCDMFLGVPFNIASYALLTMMVAKLTGLEPGELVHTLGDYHIYLNHIEQVKLQLTREPLPLSKMIILDRGQQNIDDFCFEDFNLVDYKSHPGIKGDVAI